MGYSPGPDGEIMSEGRAVDNPPMIDLNPFASYPEVPRASLMQVAKRHWGTFLISWLLPVATVFREISLAFGHDLTWLLQIAVVGWVIGGIASNKLVVFREVSFWKAWFWAPLLPFFATVLISMIAGSLRPR